MISEVDIKDWESGDYEKVVAKDLNVGDKIKYNGTWYQVAECLKDWVYLFDRNHILCILFVDDVVLRKKEQ